MRNILCINRNGYVQASIMVTVLVALLCGAWPAQALDPAALPDGGQIVAGHGSIDQSGSTMTVTQDTSRMVANWNSFNIGQDAAVNFQQPGTESVVLNRILDQNPSQIMGSLTANGQVFLVNPAGIVFGQTATVDVGGVVASSLNLSDENFMSGRNLFETAGASGSVLNQGNINGGYVAFLGPQVENEGAITANGGSVVMAAADKVSLDFSGDGLLTYSVEQGAVDALAQNSGLLKADGGLVVMTAQAVDSLTQSVVNNSGIVEATGISEQGGRILLDADGGQATVSGTLDVSSAGQGGQVVATGDRVFIGDGAHLNASGGTGGGEVLVGGSWQNSDSSVRQATGVFVAETALLEANATDNGNGGTVVAWSDVTNPLSVTRAYGTFEAKGGPNGGDGGRIETSGRLLDVEGSQGSAAAPLGTAGLWLFDPGDVLIEDPASSFFGSWSGGNPDIWTPWNTVSRIKYTDINTKLEAGTSVTVFTTLDPLLASGMITVTSPITKAAGDTDVTLTLKAADYVAVNAPISNTGGTGKLNVVLWSDFDTDSVGDVSLPTSSSISTNGGHLWIGGGSGTTTWNGLTVGDGPAAGVTCNGAISTGGGDIAVSAEGYGISMNNASNSLTGSVTATGQNISIINSNAMTLGAVTSTGTVNIATLSGDLTLSGAVTTTNSTATISLNSARNTAAGTSTGGDILVSGGTVSVAAGGRATLYSGSVAGSTGLTDLVGSGTNRFRYNSDEAVSNYSTALATGINAIYREQPTVTVTGNDSKTYNGVPYSGGNVNSSGFVNGDTSANLTLAYGGTSQGAVNVGSYTITPSGSNGLGYGMSFLDGTLTISPAALSVTASDVSKTYGQTLFTGTEFTSSGLQNSETIGSVTLTSAGAAPTAAVSGSPYGIVASAATGGTFNAGNYIITYNDGSLTINPVALSVTASDVSKTYGQTLFTGTEFTSNGLQNGETIGSVTLTSAGAAPTAAVSGSPYGIVASAATGGTFDAGNYTITYNNGALTITPAALSVTAENDTKNFDEVPYSGGNGVTYSGFVNGETNTVLSGALSYGGNSQGATSVGTYTISPTGLTAGNYTLAYVDGSLTISQHNDPIVIISVVASINSLQYHVNFFGDAYPKGWQTFIDTLEGTVYSNLITDRTGYRND